MKNQLGDALYGIFQILFALFVLFGGFFIIAFILSKINEKAKGLTMDIPEQADPSTGTQKRCNYILTF
jgi:hypothetical protein